MGNFYEDNKDISATIDALDLSEVATLLEENFRFADEYDFAPKDAASAIDNYKRALSLCGDICANRIAPTAEETDKVGNVLNDDGSVTYTPGIRLAIKLLGGSGLMGATIPYRLGGLNMPCVVLTALNDIVSRADASLMNMFGLQGIAETINAFADEDLKQKYVPKLVTGEYTGAMVLTEPDAGSDLQSVKVSAHQDADGNWFVNGVKRFITNGCGDVLIVLARTEPEFSDGRGLSCLLVEKGPWVKVRRLEHKLGINGSPTCELVFNEAPARLIGLRKRGLITYIMALMNGARMGIAAQGTGIGEAAYRAARDYAASRKQFGTTIDAFPAVRELLSGMSVDVQASRALAYYAAKCVDMESGLSRAFEKAKGTPEAPALRARMKLYSGFNKMLTPMAKYFASEMSMRVSNGAVAVLGGSGYMKDYPVERYLRDARITTIYEGTSQLQVVAAIAGVTGGLVKAVVDDILGEGWASAHPRMEALLASLDEAIAYVKGRDDAKDYHDLSARRLVDAGIALVVAALFVMLEEKGVTGKHEALWYWLNLEFPRVRAGLEVVKGGYAGAVADFEALAPAVPNLD
ncbi:MAG: acyl-CoA dehydrogenase family protein [Kiritimatiellae bacterium]|nr:acyl-CoA dehydrogenase family protein [Kiritimatiellia bacterium]MBQ3341983.1 acyl-CoA dehydrogenase family protein [Kiritimatiellia bacterium]